MVTIKEYETCGATRNDFFNAGFKDKNGYMSYICSLYEDNIELVLMIDMDGYIVPSVVCGGDPYAPFYNEDMRHNNLVYDQVAKKYNEVMDGFVALGLLKKKEEKYMKLNSGEIPVKIKKLNKMAKIPQRGSEYAAGYDLFAAINKVISIRPGETEKIGTGVSIEIPDGYFGGIFARSGLATKRGLRPANCTGICDSDYRGEYIVAVHNDSDTEQKIYPGDKIAQLIVLPFQAVSFVEVDKLSDTNRGSGGFGSTGK